jgi:hypothetical protein
MSILTQPYGNKGWRVVFDHGDNENSEFIIQEIDEQTIDWTVISRIPSEFSQYTQLTAEEMSNDLENSESIAFHNFKKLENEFGANPMSTFSGVANTEFIDNIYTHSWRNKTNKEVPFYKVLLGFIEMRD